MGQVTTYLNNDLERQIKKTARDMNVSISKCIASILEQKVGHEWNQNVKAMAGSWHDFPQIDAIRNEMTADAPRELF